MLGSSAYLGAREMATPRQSVQASDMQGQELRYMFCYIDACRSDFGSFAGFQLNEPHYLCNKSSMTTVPSPSAAPQSNQFVQSSFLN